MGVDAEMRVLPLTRISDEELIDLAYRLAEACHDTFWFSDDKDLEGGERRRALNRVDPSETWLVPFPDERWLSVSLISRFYGVGYERGPLWNYIAVAEWLERNIHGVVIYYGGDCDSELSPWTKEDRETLLDHWAHVGGRPYYQSAGWSRTGPEPPVCPLCERPATQYGSGGAFASWMCGACHRHWVWDGNQIKGFPPSRYGEYFNSFKAADEMRKEASGKATE